MSIFGRSSGLLVSRLKALVGRIALIPQRKILFLMAQYYQPDLGAEPDSPFARDAANKLVRRGYWLDMNDRSLVMAMTNGIGAHLTNNEKRAHLTDLKRQHLIDQVCIQEILPPERG
jgi:hypothetical protein